MTEEQIKRAIESVKEELDGVRCELIEIYAEPDEDDDPAVWTPQSHIDYLESYQEELLKEYYELYAKLDELKTA